MLEAGEAAEEPRMEGGDGVVGEGEAHQPASGENGGREAGDEVARQIQLLTKWRKNTLGI